MTGHDPNGPSLAQNQMAIDLNGLAAISGIEILKVGCCGRIHIGSMLAPRAKRTKLSV